MQIPLMNTAVNHRPAQHYFCPLPLRSRDGRQTRVLRSTFCSTSIRYCFIQLSRKRTAHRESLASLALGAFTFPRGRETGPRVFMSKYRARALCKWAPRAQLNRARDAKLDKGTFFSTRCEARMNAPCAMKSIIASITCWRRYPQVTLTNDCTQKNFN